MAPVYLSVTVLRSTHAIVDPQRGVYGGAALSGTAIFLSFDDDHEHGDEAGRVDERCHGDGSRRRPRSAVT
jgi:hypothetical protein